MRLVKTFLFVFVLFSLLLVASCTTSVGFRVTRPGQLDLNGAKTIAVLPFKPYAYYKLDSDASTAKKLVYSFFQIFDKTGPEEKKALEYLQSNIEDGLNSSPYIELIPASKVTNALNKGYINPADVYLAGEVTLFSITDEKTVDKVVVEEADSSTGKKETYDYVTKYVRRVQFDLKYQVIDSSDETILAYNTISIDNTSSKYDSKSDFPSAYSLIESDLYNAYRRILKELQPWVAYRTVTLLKDKSKNEDFKKATQFAKDKKIDLSYDMFKKVYDETGMFEAGYNAALLQMALGNLSVSEKEMNDLYKKTADQRASRALNDIQNEIKLAKKLKNQIEEKELTLD